MVNRVLTSPYLWWFDPFPAGLDGRPAARECWRFTVWQSPLHPVRRRPPAARESERSPFLRTAELLAPYQPGKPLIALSLGEPQHPVPAFVGPVLAKHIADFGRYPIAKGIEPFRRAAANWLSTRFDLPRPIDPETELLVLNGSREGLFFAALTAARYVGERKGTPAILIPNPFYPAYAAGARAAGCEAIYLPTTLANGFLPDLDALDDATLARTVAIFIASPANPQGAVASKQYFGRLKQLADRFGFMILSDECYSEIYTKEAPGSMLECAGPDFTNVVAFQSLSKRSNLPGMRVGFAAGDRKFLGHVPRAAQCRGTAGAGAAAACRGRGLQPTRRMSRRTAGSTGSNSISPTRSSAIAMAMSGLPAASASGSMCRNAAATKPRRSSSTGTPACA